MPSTATKKYMPDKKIRVVRDNLNTFYFFMLERHKIWRKRFLFKKERPWTKNVILNEYKFTNVYRELDRNTLWLIDNVIRTKIDDKNMMWKIIVFRYFNKPELFEVIGGIPDLDKFDSKKFEKSILKYKEEHGRIFTDAYMINPPKKKEDVKIGIERFYCNQISRLNKIFEDLWNSYKEYKTPREFNKYLTDNLYCIANFLAYEIYCDLCYTKWFKWGENDFVNVGPGAKFGLDLIFPNRKNRDYTQDLMLLHRISESYYKKYFNVVFPYLKEPLYKEEKKLTLRCIEHSLCEYSKYWKMQLDVGKPRKKFVPRTN